MVQQLSKSDLLFVTDLCKIAIAKKDPQVRIQMHPVVPGRGWDERRSLEAAYYLLNLAAQTAKRNVRRAEGYVNRAMGMMEVYGVVPKADDDEGKAALSSFSFPADKKPS